MGVQILHNGKLPLPHPAKRHTRFTVWFANQAIARVSLREAANCFNIAVQRGIVFG